MQTENSNAKEIIAVYAMFLMEFENLKSSADVKEWLSANTSSESVALACAMFITSELSR
jgi:hypothetical protein